MLAAVRGGSRSCYTVLSGCHLVDSTLLDLDPMTLIYELDLPWAALACLLCTAPPLQLLSTKLKQNTQREISVKAHFALSACIQSLAAQVFVITRLISIV